MGIGWGRGTEAELSEFEVPLDADDVPDAIQQATDLLEPAVRQLAGTDATYELSIESTDVDAYWAYWLDGAGQRARLRLNRRNARFTEVKARLCALHEILGHALQSASLASRCNRENVPRVRLLSVHSQHQVLFEGLAQALPLFVAPDDAAMTVRVRLAHYL